MKGETPLASNIFVIKKQETVDSPFPFLLQKMQKILVDSCLVEIIRG